MAAEDDETIKKKILHEIGEDLSAISIDELNARIDLLKSEIERLEAEIAAKGSSRSAADALFSKG